MKVYVTSHNSTEVPTQAKKRKGMTLVELLGVMIVIAILSVIAIGGISAARDSANKTSVISDMRTFENSVKQMLMMHPEVMKFVATKPAGATDLLIQYLNSQMEEQWAFEPIGGGASAGGGTIAANVGSGAIATTVIKRDAWGNAYCLYVYYDDLTTTYMSKDGTNSLVNSDSCVYMVIASPGKNSTGVGLGADGNNYDATSKKLVDPAQCVNNTDGVDDMGIIIRILNGDVYSATFGTDKAILGELKGIQWVFGLPSAAGEIAGAGGTGDGSGGIIHDFETTDTNTKVNGGNYPISSNMKGGSLDQFYDYNAIKAQSGVKWIGGKAAYSTDAPT